MACSSAAFKSISVPDMNKLTAPSATKSFLPNLKVNLDRNQISLNKTSSFGNFYVAKRSFSVKCQAADASRDQTKEATKVQKFCVYEFNQKDRGGPAYLNLSQKEVNSLGDLVPFTNKLYTGDLQKCIGITAGICILVQHKPEKNGDRYEAIFNHYFRDYGHISMQGPYLTYDETYLAITCGSGIFEGVSGQVKLRELIFGSKWFFTFYLKVIKDLPQELTGETVEPSSTVEPSPATLALEPNATVANYTD